MPGNFQKYRASSTHAQPVETKKGEWKSYMTADVKLGYRLASAFKVATLGMLGVTAATGALAAFAGAGLVVYGAVSLAQAGARTLAETDMKNPDIRNAAPEGRDFVKNAGRYLALKLF
jgi:hypothetical protein